MKQLGQVLSMRERALRVHEEEQRKISEAGGMAAYLRQTCPITTANLELPDDEELLRILETDFEIAERDARRCLNCPGLARTEEEIRDGKCGGTKTVIKMTNDNHLHAAFGKCEKLRAWQRQQELERNIRSARIPKRFANATFETFRVDSHNRQAYLTAKKYAEEFSGDTSDGLIIAGPVGTGKTHLAIAVLHAVLQKGVPGICVQTPELLHEIRQSYEAKDKQKDLVNLVKTAEFLVLDDLGAEKVTDWVRETIFAVIDARYRDLRPTIITTNCTLDELAERIGDRTASRIVEMCQGIYLGGKDWRLAKRDKP